MSHVHGEEREQREERCIMGAPPAVQANSCSVFLWISCLNVFPECSCDRRGTEVTLCPLESPCFCDQRMGHCPCRRGVVGEFCDECEDGFWNLDGPSGCQPCSCHPVNAFSNICDKAGAPRSVCNRTTFEFMNFMSHCRITWHELCCKVLLFTGRMNEMKTCNQRYCLTVMIHTVGEERLYWWSCDVFRCRDSVHVVQSLEGDNVMNVGEIILGILTCSVSVSEIKSLNLFWDRAPLVLFNFTFSCFQLVIVTWRERNTHHVTRKLVSVSAGPALLVSSAMSAPRVSTQRFLSVRRATRALPCGPKTSLMCSEPPRGWEP